MSYENCDTCLALKSFCDYCPTKGQSAQLPNQEELQAVLEELFNRATEHNEQLQKQLAHVRSRVVQLVGENTDLYQANTGLSEENRYLQNEKALFAEYDEQNDM